MRKKRKEGIRFTKKKLMHGGYSYLQTGQLPEDKLHIGRYLTRLRAGYIADIGPNEEDLTAGQLLLLNKLITLEGWCRCVEVEAARKQTLDLRDKYTTFTNLILKICGMLGIERSEARTFQTPLQIAADIDREKEKSKP